jgi:hypothetical protein
MNLNFSAPINPTSYGLVSSYILTYLEIRKHFVSLFPIGDIQPIYQKFGKAVQAGINNSKQFDHSAPSLRIFHQFSMGQHVGKLQKIGFPIFELEYLHDFEIHHLKYLDKILVASKWAKNVINQYMDIPVGVVPLGVDTDYFFPMKINDDNRPFIFLCVGKYEKRKNQEQIIEAFGKAFSNKDDVELHFLGMNLNKQVNQMYEQRMAPIIQNCPISYKIKQHNSQFIPPEELHRMYCITDCFILPSRGEGWAMPLLEALACGCHCIASNVTGQTEYLTDKISLLVDPIGKEPALDGIYFHGQGEWYTFSTDQIVEHMRYAYNNFKGKMNKPGVDAAREFTWMNTVEQLEKEIQGI